MKQLSIIVLLFIIMLSACKSSQKSATVVTPPAVIEDDIAKHFIDFRDASMWILGDFKPEKLLQEPHGTWYSNGYSEYTPDPDVIEEVLKLSKDSLSITIVLGTWCPDSRREVPRFMKIMDMWGFSYDKIRFIGVDIDKIAPLDDFTLLGITRVPTFIFYKNNIELGRIIEVPVTSLEQDMVKILTKE